MDLIWKVRKSHIVINFIILILCFNDMSLHKNDKRYLRGNGFQKAFLMWYYIFNLKSHNSVWENESFSHSKELAVHPRLWILFLVEETSSNSFLIITRWERISHEWSVSINTRRSFWYMILVRGGWSGVLFLEFCLIKKYHQ